MDGGRRPGPTSQGGPGPSVNNCQFKSSWLGESYLGENGRTLEGIESYIELFESQQEKGKMVFGRARAACERAIVNYRQVGDLESVKRG